MRDADGGVAAVGFDLLVFFGVFEVCWIGHLAPGTVPKGLGHFSSAARTYVMEQRILLKCGDSRPRLSSGPRPAALSRK